MEDNTIAAIAILRNHRGSARKARLVLDLIRGKRVYEAKKILEFSNKRMAEAIQKLLNSACANAAQKAAKVAADAAKTAQKATYSAAKAAEKVAKDNAYKAAIAVSSSSSTSSSGSNLGNFINTYFSIMANTNPLSMSPNFGASNFKNYNPTVKLPSGKGGITGVLKNLPAILGSKDAMLMNLPAIINPNLKPAVLPFLTGKDTGTIIELGNEKASGSNKGPLRAAPNRPDTQEKHDLHVQLDVLGIAPGVGEFFDAVNGVYYLIEGDFVNAGISFLSAVNIGEVLKLGRIAKKASSYAEIAVKRTDDVTGAVVKNVDNAAQGATSAAKAFESPRIFTNAKGQITNGIYTIDSTGMAKHTTGSTTSGKSQFLFDVDANKAVLDASAYADEFGLWNNMNQAKIPITNGSVGIHGKTGELTNWIEVTRTNTGFVHGWPCLP